MVHRGGRTGPAARRRRSVCRTGGPELRALHLTRDLPPYATGGISSAVGGLVRASQAAGLDCAVLSFDSWRPVARAREPGPPVRESYAGAAVWRVQAPSQVAAAVSEAARLRPQVVHLHDGMLWETLALLRSQVAAPFAVCLTTHVLHRHLNRLRGVEQATLSLAGQEAAMAAADAIIVPSQAAHDLLAADDPSLLPRLHRIGLGSKPPLLPRPDPGPPAPLLLYAGRFSDVKGTGELLAALPRLLAASPELWVVIAGGNPESPRSERRWLRRLVAALPEARLRSRMLFTGWLTAAALSGLLRRATLQLVPSWFESFGLSALEAMAHGVPVVGTTGGALPELVQHGRTGLLAPPGDVEALLDNVLALLADRNRAERMGQAAARRARECFSWQEVVSRHEELYRQVTARL